MDTAAIVSGLPPESPKLILGVVGQKRSIAEVEAAPHLMTTFAIRGINRAGVSLRDAVVPKGTYDRDVLKVESSRLKVTAIPDATASGPRGTVAAVSVDSTTGKRQAADTEGGMLFGGAR